MSDKPENQQTLEIAEWMSSSLLDREAGNLSPRTISFYSDKLTKFLDYCSVENIGDVEEITPNKLRHFLLWLEREGHNPGGVHCFYRSVKTFVRWYIYEMEPESYKDPFRKVKAPKIPDKTLEPISLTDINALLSTCGKNWHGIRDRAILLCLLDSGTRITEFLSLNVENVTMRTGAMYVAKGKGNKARTVYIGKTSRRALRQYVRTRKTGPLWIKKNGERLKYAGVRQILLNRAKTAQLKKTPYPHDFRRAFAVNMLRAGTDLKSIRRLMGHADLQVLRRYLALVDEDVQRAHALASPADRLRYLNKRR